MIEKCSKEKNEIEEVFIKQKMVLIEIYKIVV